MKMNGHSSGFVLALVVASVHAGKGNNPSPVPSSYPTASPSHIPTPEPTPQPSECAPCPECVLCPPGETSSFVVSGGTHDSVFPGFVGRFLPSNSFTTLSDYCPPREVSTCSKCSCNSDSECFSCVVDSTHIGYKARQAGDDDDNVKVPTYDGELSLDDYLATDDTDSLFAMLDQAQKKVEKEDEFDVLALMEKDQEENVALIHHEVNEAKIESLETVVTQEEKAISESILQLIDGSSERIAEKNSEAVKDVNSVSELEEASVVHNAIAQILDAQEAPIRKEAALEKAALEAKEKLAVESIENNHESVLSVNSAETKEEGSVMQAISKIKANLKNTPPAQDEDILSVISGFQRTEPGTTEHSDILSTLQGFEDGVTKENEEVLSMLEGFDKAVAPPVAQSEDKKNSEDLLKELATNAKVVQQDEETGVLDVLRGFESKHEEQHNAALKSSDMISEAECFICSGFTDETCALALTTVIADLADQERLSLEKELLDSDGSTCDGLKDKECLVSLDLTFATLETSGKVALLSTMCDLVTTRSSTRTSLKLGQHTGRDMVEPVKRFVKATKPVLDEKLQEPTTTAVKKAVTYSPKPVKQRVDSCAICDGFSAQTCALALTNVISGLSDKSRLSIEKELLDSDGSTCDGLKDKECLVSLDSSFIALETPNKLHLVESMCTLLTAADVPASSSNEFNPTDMTDDAISRTSHTLNTRDALLNFDAKIVKSSLLNVDVKMDALIAGLSTLDEPKCVVCEGIDDRVCLAALESSLSVLTDSQRLVVLARTMGAFPAYASCDSTEGDKTCLKKLDKTYRKLAPAHKLSILKDACTLGAYGTAAASLAAISSSAEVVTDVKQAMADWATTTTPEVHVMISNAASAAADMLAVRGGVPTLQGGRAAKLMHTLTSWTSTVSSLATDVVPVVTQTKDTSSPLTIVAASAASGIADRVRSLVTLASQPTSISPGSSTSDSSSSASSSSSVNMATRVSESAIGFIVGAVSAAGLVYAVVAVRRSFSKQRLYSKIPSEHKQKAEGPEPPAFVLSL